jgi:hypothetical protein
MRAGGAMFTIFRAAVDSTNKNLFVFFKRWFPAPLTAAYVVWSGGGTAGLGPDNRTFSVFVQVQPTQRLLNK